MCRFMLATGLLAAGGLDELVDDLLGRRQFGLVFRLGWDVLPRDRWRGEQDGQSEESRAAADGSVIHGVLR